MGAWQVPGMLLMTLERLQYLLSVAISRGDHAATIMLQARIAEARKAARVPSNRVVW